MITATSLDGDIFSRPNSFCPSDAKYTSCSDDGTVRVWDFLRCHEERICRGKSPRLRFLEYSLNSVYNVFGYKEHLAETSGSKSLTPALRFVYIGAKATSIWKDS